MRTRLAITSFLALLLAFAGACSDDEPTPEPTPEPTQSSGSGPAEQALARHVETTLQKQYLEDCTKADAGRDAGKICSVFRGEREAMRAYILGITFSEFTQWAFVENRGGQWSVVSTTPITGDNAGVPGIPWPLKLNTDVVVTGASPCVNVREGPGRSNRAVDCIADGTIIRLSAGPTDADNLRWYQVAGRTGWVVSDYLRFYAADWRAPGAAPAPEADAPDAP